MVSVLVNGPVSWNTLVYLDALPPARPHMVIADHHRVGLGGTSAGKALGLAQLGVQTTLRTVVGTDEDAGRILSALRHPALTVLADVVDGPSEHHLNLMAANGGRVSIYLDLTGQAPAPSPSVVAALGGADIAVIDLTASSLPMLAAAKSAGCEIWCDIHDYDDVADFHRPFVEAADVLVVSADRLPDPLAFLRRVVGAGASLAVCTDGARGAYALSGDGEQVAVGVAAVQQVVDTNGAGDAFVAGLLTARATGHDLAEAMRWAAAAGAIAVQSPELCSPELRPAAVQALAGTLVK